MLQLEGITKSLLCIIANAIRGFVGPVISRIQPIDLNAEHCKATYIIDIRVREWIMHMRFILVHS